MTRFPTAFVCLAAVSFTTGAQEPSQRPSRQLPPPTDVDSVLTKQLGELENRFGQAIVRRDAKVLESIVAADYTLRIADIPQGSLPRRMWMANTLKGLVGQSAEVRHVAARKLADDLAVVSSVIQTKGMMEGRDFSGDFYIVDFWKKTGGNWQIIARYSSPMGKPPERAPRRVPPPTDIDPQLTEQLRQLEQQLGDAALHGFSDTTVMWRLVAPEFTQRVADAPERSLPRSLWGQPSSAYKIDSLEQRFYAARKLADDLAVVSFILSQKAAFAGRDRSGDFYVVDVWKKSSDGWRMIARYSSPAGKIYDRSP
jgi:hypothetical protein